MHVVIDVFAAIAIISVAARAIAEFQIWVFRVGFAADGAFVVVGLLAVLALVFACPIGTGLRLRRFFGSAAANANLQRVRQKIHTVFSKKQEIRNQRQRRKQIDGEGLTEQIGKNIQRFQPCKIFHPNGDDVKQVNAAIGTDRSQCKEQREIRKQRHRKIDPMRDQANDHTQQGQNECIGKVEQIEPEPTHGCFQRSADKVVEKQR